MTTEITSDTPLPLDFEVLKRLAKIGEPHHHAQLEAVRREFGEVRGSDSTGFRPVKPPRRQRDHYLSAGRSFPDQPPQSNKGSPVGSGAAVHA